MLEAIHLQVADKSYIIMHGPPKRIPIYTLTLEQSVHTIVLSSRLSITGTTRQPCQPMAVHFIHGGPVHLAFVASHW